jgi:hypothetical protein
MRHTLLALAITAAAAWGTASASAVAAEPSLTLHEYCPVINGQQRYGVEAVATGVQPSAIFIWSWGYKPLPGETGGETSDAWQATTNGVVGPFRLRFDRPMKYLDVFLNQVHPQPPEGTAQLRERIKKPCKHIDTTR